MFIDLIGLKNAFKTKALYLVFGVRLVNFVTDEENACIIFVVIAGLTEPIIFHALR